MLLKKLRPRKKTSILMEVHDNNGFSTGPDVVLDRWKDDFNSLYSPPGGIIL